MAEVIANLARDLLLVGGPVFTAWLVNRMNRDREEARYEKERKRQIADIRRRKLEELYQAIEHQRKALASLMVGSLQIAGGLGAPKEVVKFDSSKIAMLVGIYLPNAKPLLDAVSQKERLHGIAMVELAKDPKSVTRLTTANSTASEVQASSAALQDAIAEAAAGTL